MTTRTMQQETSAYITAVRTALRDVPADEREGAARDVEAYLAEVISELGDDADATSLHDRLGSPEHYAAQLREAAGYDPPPLADALWGRNVRWRNLLLALGVTAYFFGITSCLLEWRENIAFWTGYVDPWSEPLYFVGPVGLILVGLGLLIWAVKRGLSPRVSSWLGRVRATGPATIGRWGLWILRGWSATFVIDQILLSEGYLQRWLGPETAVTADLDSPLDYFAHWTTTVLLAVVVMVSVILGRYERRLHDWRILVVPLNLALVLWVPLAWQLSWI